MKPSLNWKNSTLFSLGLLTSLAPLAKADWTYPPYAGGPSATMNRVELFQSDSCGRGALGFIDAYTDCRVFAGTSVWGISVNGVCKNIQDMDGAKACERFRAFATQNEYDLISHYRSDRCASDLVAVQDRYSQNVSNSGDSVWAVSHQGRCYNLEDTSLDQAAQRVRGLFAPEYSQITFHQSDSCNGNIIAILDRSQGCGSVGYISQSVWGISEGGRCTDIADASFEAACSRFAGAPYPGNPYPGNPYPGNPAPGNPYPPSNPYPGNPYPGNPYPGNPYPGNPGGPGHGGPGHGGPGHDNPGNGTDLYYSHGPIGRGATVLLGDTGKVSKSKVETRTIVLQPENQRVFYNGLQLNARDDIFHIEKLIVTFGNGETAMLGAIDIRENDIIWVDFESRRGRDHDSRRIREVTVIGNSGNMFGTKARLEILGISDRGYPDRPGPRR